MATQHKGTGLGSLTCDLCHSTEIAETGGEFVCKSCGVVLKYKHFASNLPYRSESFQTEIITQTMVGSFRERGRTLQDAKFRRLQTLQIQSKTKEDVLEAKICKEVSRLIGALRLQISLKKNRSLTDKIKKAYRTIQKGTKLRNIERLSALILYYYCKHNKIHIKKSDLFEHSILCTQEFNSYVYDILSFFPKLKEEEKKEIVSQKLIFLAESELGMRFYFRAKDLLYRIWPMVKYAKEDVIAAVLSSLIVLSNESLIKMISINKICTLLEVRMSTVQSNIKKNIINTLKVEGFTSLVQSKEIIKSIVEKLISPLAKREGEKSADIKKTPDDSEKEDIEFLDNVKVKPKDISSELSYTIFSFEDGKENKIFLAQNAEGNNEIIGLAIPFTHDNKGPP